MRRGFGAGSTRVFTRRIPPGRRPFRARRDHITTPGTQTRDPTRPGPEARRIFSITISNLQSEGWNLPGGKPEGPPINSRLTRSNRALPVQSQAYRISLILRNGVFRTPFLSTFFSNGIFNRQPPAKKYIEISEANRKST